jgi:stage III sporulation protein AE
VSGRTVRVLLSLLVACFAVVCFGQLAFADTLPNGIPPPATVTGTSLFGSQTGSMAEDTLQNAANAQLEHLPTEEIDAFWKELQSQYSGYLPDVSGSSIVHALVSNGGPSFSGLMHGLLRYFLSVLTDNTTLVGGILVLSVLAAVLESIQSAFDKQAVSQVAYAVIFLVLLVIAIGSFTEAIGYARHAIESMNDFMLSTVPIAVALLAASGAVASAAFFQPVLIFIVHFVSNMIFLFVFPLIYFSAVLDVTSSLSSRYKLTRLAGLMRTVGMATLGICSSAFLGITAVQGAGKGISDGVALRAVKFSVNTFVPVVGKAVSDATETVLSASLLVKNAVGIAGIIIIACIAIFPALKVLAISMIYGGTAALMQPMGDNPMIACLGTLSKSLVLVFACVMIVALMFFLSICILLASANLAVMMA